MMVAAQRSPLHERHVAMGAKLAEFGGWEMPIEYSDAGVLKEHAAVREAVGIFDVSHLGKVLVRGAGAAAFVNSALTNDLGRIRPGQAQYTLCCDDMTGGVVDDLIAYLRSPDEVLLVPNAANAADVVRRLRAAAPGCLEVFDQHNAYAVLAVQGPRSADLLARLGIPADHRYMSFVDAELPKRPERPEQHGRALVVCRSGYTGERGYELLSRSSDALELWDALLEAGADLGVQACGLGARDTLRTEMGYPLHGQDLSLEITPVQARLGWAVGWSKPAFWGRERLLHEREVGPTRLLRGIVAEGRGIPRPHMTVTTPQGDKVGEVTSGTFSPTRRVGIGLALLDPSLADGDEVRVDVRGRPVAMRITKPPFVVSSTQ